jgi:glyoxylase-like metal-dependent hydrolase (beta-lactamase superfamily II)
MKEKKFGPVLFIPGLNKGRYPYCNSIYIEGPGILIDPASDRERLLRLREEEEIKQVWLTHFHEDHIMHLDLFDDIPLFISEEDSAPISDINNFMDWDWFELNDDEREWWMTALKNNFNYKPRKPAAFLKGNDVFMKKGVTIEVIRTPGHTPGNLSFYIKEPRVLFIGDYDLTGFGPYYGDRDSSIEDTIESIGKLREIPAKTILTSHETGIFENPESSLWDRYIEVIYKRENKLLEFLTTPRSMRDIINAHIVYGRPREPKSFFELGERALMRKHLELLLSKRLISYDGEAYRKI